MNEGNARRPLLADRCIIIQGNARRPLFPERGIINEGNAQRPLSPERCIINHGKARRSPTTTARYNKKMHIQPFYQSTL